MTTFYAGRITYWKLSCPHCGNRYSETLRDPSELRIGRRLKTCPKCHREFAINRKEWEQMNTQQKKTFLTSDLKMAGWVLGVFLIGGFMALLSGSGSGNGAAVIGVFILVLLGLLAVTYIVRFADIGLSKLRYRAPSVKEHRQQATPAPLRDE
jgi:hypothetical protein